MKAAAAANTGLQRAASHNNKGNSEASGTTVAQDSRGRKITMPLSTLSAASALRPSMTSRARRRIARVRGQSDQDAEQL